MWGVRGALEYPNALDSQGVRTLAVDICNRRTSRLTSHGQASWPECVGSTVWHAPFARCERMESTHDRVGR
jgi:hypothetical protein